MCVCVWRSQLSTLTEILFREPGPAFVGRGVTRRRNVREKGNFSSDYRPERMTEQPPLLLLLPFFKSNKKKKSEWKEVRMKEGSKK